MTITKPRLAAAASLAAIGFSLVAVTACSSGSATVAGPGAAGASTPAAGAPAAAGQTSGKPLNGCTLVTPQELSQAVGVKYTAISGAGTLCNVTGASDTSSFSYAVNKEGGPLNTWSGTVATIKADDGSVTSVSGIGDRAAQGGAKEFAAESGGYIVVVINADFNVATASTFTRTKKIEKLLLSKL